MALIRAEQIRKNYVQGKQIVEVLKGVEFCAGQGEFIAVLGASGSGKTTLLHTLAGFEKPDAGRIWIGGYPLHQMKEKEKTIFRRRNIGFVFQESSLIQTLNVEENIVLQGSFDSGIYLDRTFLDSLICYLGLENLRHHYPRELSGGERQRVAIARAVYGKTRVIMADEPTANLDSRQSLKAATLLKDCCRTYYQTILMATHNPVIAQVCDRAVHLENGVLTEG